MRNAKVQGLNIYSDKECFLRDSYRPSGAPAQCPSDMKGDCAHELADGSQQTSRFRRTPNAGYNWSTRRGDDTLVYFGKSIEHRSNGELGGEKSPSIGIYDAQCVRF